MAAPRYQLPTILNEAERMVGDVERIVRTFPRYHRYTIGGDLRRQAMGVWQTAQRAWFKPNERRGLADQLVDAIEDLKLYLKTAKIINAFPNGFRSFSHLARQAHALGNQAGGWRRSLSNPQQARNVQGDAVAQRGQELGTRAAPARANT